MDPYDDPDIESQLYDQLFAALESLGYDENRGDWWRISFDGGAEWGVKAVIGDEDIALDVTLTGYEIVESV